jgi:hypothetical protein
MKVYIAGQMTGLPAFNYPAFMAAEERLRAAGYDVVNPATLHGDVPPGSQSTAEYIRTDLRALLDCDGIYLLRNWNGSRNAVLEYRVAVAIGLVVMHESREDV